MTAPTIVGSVYRIDAHAIHDAWGWAVTTRTSRGIETVARVDGPGKPWELRELAARELTFVAARRLVGAA